jgi:hypothetical protein
MGEGEEQSGRGSLGLKGPDACLITVAADYPSLYLSKYETRKMNVRFVGFRAVTVKNVVFWVMKIQFVLHRRHIISPLQSPAG